MSFVHEPPPQCVGSRESACPRNCIARPNMTSLSSHGTIHFAKRKRTTMGRLVLCTSIAAVAAWSTTFPIAAVFTCVHTILARQSGTLLEVKVERSASKIDLGASVSYLQSSYCKNYLLECNLEDFGSHFDTLETFKNELSPAREHEFRIFGLLSKKC